MKRKKTQLSLLKRSGDWDLLKAEKVSPETYEIEVARVKDEEETGKEK